MSPHIMSKEEEHIAYAGDKKKSQIQQYKHIYSHEMRRKYANSPFFFLGAFAIGIVIFVHIFNSIEFPDIPEEELNELKVVNLLKVEQILLKESCKLYNYSLEKIMNLVESNDKHDCIDLLKNHLTIEVNNENLTVPQPFQEVVNGKGKMIAEKGQKK